MIQSCPMLAVDVEAALVHESRGYAFLNAAKENSHEDLGSTLGQESQFC
jgi:hypothetical protein